MSKQEYSWLEEQTVETISPWVHLSLDPKSQTGGDWYRLFLNASLGCRAAHGVNTSPSCEVLCKANRAQIESDNYGLISWDDTKKAPSILGADISDMFYTHSQYRGNITASGSILAYESGLWEPSMRKRARSSALLAAGLVVHGKTNVEACNIVSRLTCEPIDIEAVDNAVIPASHLKREMVIVSKASHRVFGRGTIQCGITWDDNRLSSRACSQNMAFDWGRITAIARYIAEANIQNCKMFTYHAKARGIPFTVVRNSWAYVSEADYHLPSSIFSDVPKLDLKRFGIPSLVGTFIGHEVEVMRALNRGSKFMDVVPENEAFRAYLKMHKEARSRRGRRGSRRIPSISDAREVNIEEHSLTEDQLQAALEGGLILKEALVTAIASRRQTEDSLDKLLREVALVVPESEPDYTPVDKATKLIYDRSTWILARFVAESALREKGPEDDVDRGYLLDRITSKLSDMKAEIVGYRTHLETGLFLSTSQVSKLRLQTISYAQKSEKSKGRVTFSQRSLASAQLRNTALALGGIGEHQEETMRELKSTIASRYEDWYSQVLSDPDANVKENLAYFAYIQSFLADITPTTCYQKESGYIEGTVPRKSYVYQGLLRTAADYQFTPPKMQHSTYSTAYQLAQELDSSGTVPYSVTDAVDEVLKIADEVVGDLMLGRLWQPDVDTFYDARMMFAAPLSPQYDDNMLREEEAHTTLGIYLAEIEEKRKRLVKEGYEDCLNTYPNPTMAEEIAKANGYPNLRAAYEVLGTEAEYTETSKFVMDAQTKMALEKGASRHGYSTGESSKKRKYGAIM
jgi:hypothetical protein